MLRKGLYLLPSLTRTAPILTKPHNLKFLSQLSSSTFLTNNKESEQSVQPVQPVPPSKKISDKEAAELREKEEELKKAGQGLVGAGMIKMLLERDQQVKELSKEKAIPDGALVAGILLTTPLFLGSLATGYFAYADMFLPNLPTYFLSLMKYAGLHLSFMSGIHWGFAVSEHDCQLDFERSSPYVRKYFTLAALPLALSFMFTGNLVYGFALSSVNFKVANLMGLLGTHLMVFLGDCYMYRKRRVPMWYLRLKLMITFFVFLSLSAMAITVTTAESKLKVENDPLRKEHIPTDTEILSGNLSGK